MVFWARKIKFWLKACMNREDITLGSLGQRFRTHVRRRVVSTGCCWSCESKPSSHFHGLDAGSVTVSIRDYPWDIRPGSVDMAVMFRDQQARFRRLNFSVARFSTCSNISFFFRSRPQLTVRNRSRRDATAAYQHLVHGLKLVIVYHGTHHGYAVVEHFSKELWWYSHNSYSPLRHCRKVTTAAKRRRFCDG